MLQTQNQCNGPQRNGVLFLEIQLIFKRFRYSAFYKFSKRVVERKALHVSTIYNIYTGRDRSLEVEGSYAKLNILRDCSLESEALLFLGNAEIVEEHLPLEGPKVALPRRLTS